MPTHVTTLVFIQRGQFGPAHKPKVHADQAKRKREIGSMGLCQSIRQYSAHGKGPADTWSSGKTGDEWFKCNERLHSEAYMMDLAWALVKMTQLNLFEVDLFQSEKQTVHEWSGFNTVVHSCVPVQTNIGYCPMVDGSPAEFSTVYTVMKNVQSMMALLTQNYSVITFDISIYVKAKEIQWRIRQEFESLVIRMGGFHIVMNYLAVLEKKYQSSGMTVRQLQSC